MTASDKPAGMTADRQPARLKGGGIRTDDDMAVDALLTDDDDEADIPVEERQERLLDEGIEETFPASDPVSVKHIT